MLCRVLLWIPQKTQVNMKYVTSVENLPQGFERTEEPFRHVQQEILSLIGSSPSLAEPFRHVPLEISQLDSEPLLNRSRKIVNETQSKH